MENILWKTSYGKHLIEKSIQKYDWNVHEYYRLQKKSYNPKWLINLSNEVIPDVVAYYLSLDHKFSTIPFDKSNIIERSLASVEEQMYMIDAEYENDTRSNINNIFTRYMFSNFSNGKDFGYVDLALK